MSDCTHEFKRLTRVAGYRDTNTVDYYYTCLSCGCYIKETDARLTSVTNWADVTVNYDDNSTMDHGAGFDVNEAPVGKKATTLDFKPKVAALKPFSVTIPDGGKPMFFLRTVSGYYAGADGIKQHETRREYVVGYVTKDGDRIFKAINVHTGEERSETDKVEPR